MRFVALLLATLLWGCAPDSEAPGKPDREPAAEPATAPQPGAGGPVVSDAWARSVPPGARMTAGYLTLHNPGPEDIVVVGAESPRFGSVEIHGTEVVGGVARMRHQESVTVPAGESLSFSPGGLHLMLMQAVDGVPSDGAIELTLLLGDGRRLDFDAQVGQAGN